MNLVFDSGNTFVKVALFENGQLTQLIPKQNTDDIEKWIAYFSPSQSLIADVSGKNERLLAYLSQKYATKILSYQTPIPLKNLYKTPQTLGVDRLAAAIGAFVHTQTDTLVIDAGTCITYDFVSQNAEFLGGNIAAGLQMRLRAVHHFTGKLPLVELDFPVPTVGQSTQEALAAGAFWGLIREIEGTIQFFQKKYPKLQVVLSGGDSAVLAKYILYPCNHFPNLVLYGLNEILCYQNP